MLLKEWLAELNNLIQQNPQILDYKIVTAIDGEGNSFFEVWNQASFGYFTEDDDFVPVPQFAEWDIEPEQANAVCLN